ncbi:hypothetical protein MHH52_11090 [Paenibacillus sp. FSL K6-0276]|uniref:hypothetical protein n=1 Tax=Paenibacillus sp. FSL K6-0276 TaxID=2921450 RepID=UPI0030EBB5E2
MRKGKPIKKKVYGFILQDNEVGEKTLLVYLNVPEVPFRLVGGNVDPGKQKKKPYSGKFKKKVDLNNLN